MFERFRQRYKVTSQLPVNPSHPIITSELENTRGYEAFMREYAGATFNGGLYRVHTLENRARWTGLIEEAYPKYNGRIAAFGYDWLGRQFALDSKRRQDNEPLVLMFDPGTGEVLQVPSSFYGFHESELVDHADDALGEGAFMEWLREGHPAPDATQCAGHKIPLFLGGADEFENYELINTEVYWGINAQILDQIRDLPEGTPIGKITID